MPTLLASMVSFLAELIVQLPHCHWTLLQIYNFTEANCNALTYQSERQRLGPEGMGDVQNQEGKHWEVGTLGNQLQGAEGRHHQLQEVEDRRLQPQEVEGRELQPQGGRWVGTQGPLPQQP